MIFVRSHRRRATRRPTSCGSRRCSGPTARNSPGSQLSDGSLDGEFGGETETALQAVTGLTVADDAQWVKLLGA